MKVAKKTAEYTVYLRNDKRYAVRAANRTWVNGDDKVAILQKEGLVKAPEPKAEAPEEVVETDATAPEDETAEAPAEEEKSDD